MCVYIFRCGVQLTEFLGLCRQWTVCAANTGHAAAPAGAAFLPPTVFCARQRLLTHAQHPFLKGVAARRESAPGAAVSVSLSILSQSKTLLHVAPESRTKTAPAQGRDRLAGPLSASSSDNLRPLCVLACVCVLVQLLRKARVLLPQAYGQSIPLSLHALCALSLCSPWRPQQLRRMQRASSLPFFLRSQSWQTGPSPPDAASPAPYQTCC